MFRWLRLGSSTSWVSLCLLPTLRFGFSSLSGDIPIFSRLLPLSAFQNGGRALEQKWFGEDVCLLAAFVPCDTAKGDPLRCPLVGTAWKLIKRKDGKLPRALPAGRFIFLYKNHLSLVKGNKLCPPHVSLFFVHLTEAFLCLQFFLFF